MEVWSSYSRTYGWSLGRAIVCLILVFCSVFFTSSPTHPMLSASMKVFMFKQCGKDVKPTWSRSSLCHSSHLVAAQEVLPHEENEPDFHSATIKIGWCQVRFSSEGRYKDLEPRKSSIFLGLRVKHPDSRPEFPE